MKGLVFGLLFGFGAIAAHGQVKDASVCDIINHPKKFDGQMVRVKGVVQTGFDSLLILGESCDSALWLSYPAGTKAKSGPAAVLTMQLASNSNASTPAAKPAVVLDRNADFATFDALLSAKVKTPGICLGCVKNDVTATLVGRVDGADDTGLTRDASGTITALNGFGNLNAYATRLVLQSVSAATATEIDYTKLPKVKDDGQGSGDKDYSKLAHGAAALFPKGSDAAATIERALAAYGPQGQDNGVVVSFGGTADGPEEGKSSKSSPDGLILLVRFDMDKLKGDALSRAAVHEGSEIAAEREKTVTGISAVEQSAWQATLLTTIGERGKTLTLPGGYLMWNDSWTADEKTPNASAALTGYLSTHERTPR